MKLVKKKNQARCVLQNVHVTMGSVQTVWPEQEDAIVIKVGKELPVLWVRSLMGENNSPTF